MSRYAGWGLALASGVVWALCFQAASRPLASCLALVPFLLLLSRPGRLLHGWLHGLTFWLISIPWIVPTLVGYGSLPNWLAVAGLLALALYLGLFSAGFALFAGFRWQRGAAMTLIALPSAWVLVEWLRGFLLSGFPWNLAAYAWTDMPGALPLAAWVGPWGVSYLVVFVNTGIFLSVAKRQLRFALVAIGLASVVLALGARFAGPAEPLPVATKPSAIRILQPNIEIVTEWSAERIEENYQRVFAQASAACDAPGVLLVWPESAAWPYAFDQHERLRRDLGRLLEAGCGVLLNSSMESTDGTYNSVLLLGSSGDEPQRYDKEHLVPFGEYVPLARWLPFLKKLARNAGEFAVGRNGSPLVWGAERLGVAICFEITFPGEVARRVRQGSTLLVTVTNDAWYGDSSAPWQHYRAARFRAAENGRYLLRSALTGVSAIVSPQGRVVHQLSVGEEGVLSHRVVGETTLTLFTRLPWLVPALCGLLYGFAILTYREERP